MKRKPGTCAEPKAVSDFLKKSGVPNDADDATVAKALKGMKIEAKDGADTRAPCKNCSQFLAKLKSTYGAPDSADIASGTTRKGGTTTRNFSPPNATTKPTGGTYFQAYP